MKSECILADYLKLRWRDLFKYKMFSFVNIFGRSASMPVYMLIMVRWVDQKRYYQFEA
ncbi:MAG: hypothetical protein IPF93_10775 [Saprospiraceae bacterium]|nr:hypothetical protein [Saprospiraceae bacterium]